MKTLHQTVNDEGQVPISQFSVISNKCSCHYCGHEDNDFNLKEICVDGDRKAYICTPCDITLPECMGCGEKIGKYEPRLGDFHLNCVD